MTANKLCAWILRTFTNRAPTLMILGITKTGLGGFLPFLHPEILDCVRLCHELASIGGSRYFVGSQPIMMRHCDVMMWVCPGAVIGYFSYICDTPLLLFYYKISW